jgi:hypothetical protein
MATLDAAWHEAALVIAFASPATLVCEADRPSALPITGNGPPGTFVVFASGWRVSLPTDQIVAADERNGRVRVGFGGMQWVGETDGVLVCDRVREVWPESRLSPARSHQMRLEARWVEAIVQDGVPVWPPGASGARAGEGA